MSTQFEDLMKLAYQYWKKSRLEAHESHPEEENLACFLEGKLSLDESDKIKEHILHCDSCLEIISIAIKLNNSPEIDIPQELVLKAKNLVAQKESLPLFEIWLKLKDNILEVINTSGDILVGQELLPAPVLRTRKIKHFKDTVTILKDFKDIRIEVKIDNKQGKFFNLAITLRDKKTQKEAKDLRVTLMKEDLELESYIVKNGKVVFEHIHLGTYSIEVSSPIEKLASISLDIKT
jgi:hypothetical protein